KAKRRQSLIAEAGPALQASGCRIWRRYPPDTRSHLLPVSNDMEIGARQTKEGAGQDDLHVCRMNVRGGHGLLAVRVVAKDPRISTDLDVSDAVRIEGQVAGAGQRALERWNAVNSIDASNVVEVDHIVHVVEILDRVVAGRRRVRNRLEHES